jgi:uncharacterized protein YbaP (TraB family)
VGRRRHLSWITLTLCTGVTACFAAPPAWQVSDGRGGTVWLLGSVHYLRAEDHPLPELVDALYSEASGLVMELDLDDLDPIATQASLLSAAALPPDTTLERLLGAELWVLLRHKTEAFGLPAEALSGVEPWFAALTVFDLGMLQAGFGASFGLEQTLLRYAQRDRLPVMGLETLEQQLDLFESLSLQEQRRLLEQTLRELDVNATMIAELVGAWRDGDLAALESALLGEMRRSPDLYEALVSRRNRQWVASVGKLLEMRQAYLVVVGALHLVGASSLVELLEDEGYELTRITRWPN